MQTRELVRVTLVHNPNAGDRRTPDSAEMVSAIEALGWKAAVVERGELDRGLRNPGEAVLVAGGDGTVGQVAKRLAGKAIPMGIIPTGTANNVARTLGIGVDARTAISSLKRAVIREVNLGVVRNGDAGVEHFLEGVGVGLFAWVMAERATRKHKQLRRAFGLIAEELEWYQPRRACIEIDGRLLAGEYLLASVMNLRSLGPALDLAPDALFDDGLLDVVVVRPEHRESLLAHLKRAAVEGELPLPRFEIHRAEYVRLSGHGKWAHVNDCSRELAGDIEARVEPRTVKFFVPPPTENETPR